MQSFHELLAFFASPFGLPFGLAIIAGLTYYAIAAVFYLFIAD